jgi:hypothetical protein
MRESLAPHMQKRDAIDEEIAERIKIHQRRIASLKVAAAALSAAGVQPQSTPLVMLAHGDSWFDYPLSGNDLSFRDTDIIAQLRGMGRVNPMILNISHYGDATTEEMSLPKQERRSRPSSECRFGTVAEGPSKGGGAVEVVSAVVRRRAAIDGMADCAAAAALLSSPAPSAHRCAAAGLDSSTAAERLASMPSTAQWIA